MAKYAMRKSIETSPGILKQHKDLNDKGINIQIREKTIRTVDSTPKPKNSEANIQREEYCLTEENCPIVSLNYTMKIVDPFKEEMSDEPDFSRGISEFLSFKNEVKEMAEVFISEGFANRIVAAIPAARNRDIAIDIITQVKLIKNNELLEELEFPLCHLMGYSLVDSQNNIIKPFNIVDFEKLSIFIREALFGENEDSYIIKVKSYLDMGSGNMEIYPSQEFSDSKDKYGLGKILYSVDGKKEKAGMTSQKIQNRLRSFDIFSKKGKQIPFYEWGNDLSVGEAYRTSKNSFYAYKKNFLTLKEGEENKFEELSKEEMIFILALIIKGGVWGEK